MNYTTEINGSTLEYFDDTHTYLVDGIIVPSITQVLDVIYPRRYASVPKDVLRQAAEEGTKVHNAIEAYCKTGIEADLPEVKNFCFLQKHYGFEVLDNEVPVILKTDDLTVAGRLDMVLKMGDTIGLADIKRTSTLNKEYLTAQLNLYRIAFEQSYGLKVEFLRGIWLRNDVRKFVRINIDRTQTAVLMAKYKEEKAI